MLCEFLDRRQQCLAQAKRLVFLFLELVQVVLHDDFILSEQVSKLLVFSPQLLVLVFNGCEVILLNGVLVVYWQAVRGLPSHCVATSFGAYCFLVDERVVVSLSLEPLAETSLVYLQTIVC